MLNDYLLNMYLRGFKTMGVNYKKIEMHAKWKQAQKEYEDFKKQFDLNPIVDYFEVGLKAKIFKNPLNGQPLTENDSLFWGFNHDGYQYTLRRQPISTVPRMEPQNPLNSLLRTSRIGKGAPK